MLQQRQFCQKSFANLTYSKVIHLSRNYMSKIGRFFLTSFKKRTYNYPRWESNSQPLAPEAFHRSIRYCYIRSYNAFFVLKWEFQVNNKSLKNCFQVAITWRLTHLVTHFYWCLILPAIDSTVAYITLFLSTILSMSSFFIIGIILS